MVLNILRWVVLVPLTIFLAWLTFRVFARFITEMDPSERNPRPGVWLEANWGGLGGGLSGWRVSNAFIYLLLLSLLLGCLSLAVFSLQPTAEKRDQTQSESTSDRGGNDGPRKTDEKSNANKSDASGAKPLDTKQSDQKQIETKKAESPSSGKSGEKSLTPQADTKTPALKQPAK